MKKRSFTRKARKAQQNELVKSSGWSRKDARKNVRLVLPSKTDLRPKRFKGWSIAKHRPTINQHGIGLEAELQKTYWESLSDQMKGGIRPGESLVWASRRYNKNT